MPDNLQPMVMPLVENYEWATFPCELNLHPVVWAPIFLYPIMKFTQQSLQKLENILTEGGYLLRYERGSFQSGYCLLEHKKVVVLNKFLNLEGRINTLYDLIPQLLVNADALTQESQKLYDQVMKAVAAAK
jgi:hypothetical protein